MAGNQTGDYDLYYQRSADGGVTWTPVAHRTTYGPTDTNSDVNPSLATDRLGYWVLVWSSSNKLGLSTSTNGTNRLVSLPLFILPLVAGYGSERDLLWMYSNDSLATWTSPMILNADANSDAYDDLYPVIATDSTSTSLLLMPAPTPLFPGIELILYMM